MLIFVKLDLENYIDELKPWPVFHNKYFLLLGRYRLYQTNPGKTLVSNL